MSSAPLPKLEGGREGGFFGELKTLGTLTNFVLNHTKT